MESENFYIEEAKRVAKDVLADYEIDVDAATNEDNFAESKDIGEELWFEEEEKLAA